MGRKAPGVCSGNMGVFLVDRRCTLPATCSLKELISDARSRGEPPCSNIYTDVHVFAPLTLYFLARGRHGGRRTIYRPYLS